MMAGGSIALLLLCSMPIFSLGLAAVLTVVGLLFVKGSRIVQRVPRLTAWSRYLPVASALVITVDIKNATWTNTIGAPELITVWKDPEFDPKQYAFYYARVLEIPTPRWTAYEAKRYGIKMSKKVPMVIQERAYTSPIWYSSE